MANHLGSRVYSMTSDLLTAFSLSCAKNLLRSMVCVPGMLRLKALVSVMFCMSDNTGRYRCSPSLTRSTITVELAVNKGPLQLPGKSVTADASKRRSSQWWHAFWQRSYIKSAHPDAARITTGMLNNVLADAQTRVQPPTDKGRRLKIYYMTQVGVKPPHFVIFCNDARLFHFSYQRYIENCIRNTFGLEGTPVVLSIRQKGDKEE